MAYPTLKQKHLYDPICKPDEFIKYLKSVGSIPKFDCPEGIIFCYSRSFLKYILETEDFLKIDPSLGDLYLSKHSKIGICANFGIGAPGVSALLEELVSHGAKRFISIGTAGALQKKSKIGDIVVCDKALRDEGVSYHYLSDSKYSYPSKELTNSLIENLNKQNINFDIGSTWTIDAPYRETVEEVRQYQKEGVMTVEMEAAALFAVAKCRNVDLSSAFVISDSLADLCWNPQFKSDETKQGMIKLYNASISTLKELKG